MASIRAWILVALVACTLLASTSEVIAGASNINYNSIRRGDSIPCNKVEGSQTNCKRPKEANPSTRGCNPNERCREY